MILNGLTGTGSASVFQAKVKMHCFLMYFPIELGFIPRYFCRKPVFMSSWKVHVDQSKHFKNMPHINQTISHNSNCYMKKEYKQKKINRAGCCCPLYFSITSEKILSPKVLVERHSQVGSDLEETEFLLRN